MYKIYFLKESVRGQRSQWSLGKVLPEPKRMRPTTGSVGT